MFFVVGTDDGVLGTIVATSVVVFAANGELVATAAVLLVGVACEGVGWVVVTGVVFT